MKMTVESRASYHSMAFKWCADVIWNSLKTIITDEKFDKKERVNQRVYGYGWRFFDCQVLRKKGNTFKLGKKKNYKKKREPRPNRVITTAL